MRILLVEDHPDSAEILTVLLEGNGHEVFAVGTAKDALRA
jgi:CheY-like chemotaxis protein